MLSLVSIIITTKNEAAVIKRLLVSLKDQSYKNIEIIVVDHPATIDKTGRIAKRYTRNVFVKGPERSTQRNFAITKSKGRYILILDADMNLSKDVVKECVDIFTRQKKKEKIGGVIIPEKSYGAGIWAKAKALEREVNKGEEYFEAARFFPKNVFEEFGGYDTSLTGPEDWDLPQRISRKYKIFRIRSFIRHSEGRPTLIGLAKRKYYYGLSVDKYLKKQNLPIIGKTTVYFLRPAFYRNWRLIVRDPWTGFCMIVMLFFENFGGGLGYLAGKFRK